MKLSTDQVLATLRLERGSFVCELPPEAGTFLGRPVGLVIEVCNRLCEHEHSTDEIEPDHIATLGVVLGNLPGILADATRFFMLYEAGEPNSVELIARSHIWLSHPLHEEGQEPMDQGPLPWTLVAEADKDCGIAWHIEFNGTEFNEIWAGS